MITFKYCEITYDTYKQYLADLQMQIDSRKKLREYVARDYLYKVISLSGALVYTGFCCYSDGFKKMFDIFNESMNNQMLAIAKASLIVLILLVIIIGIVGEILVRIFMPNYKHICKEISALASSKNDLQELEQNIYIINSLRRLSQIGVIEICAASRTAYGLLIKFEENGYVNRYEYHASDDELHKLCKPNLLDFSYMDEKVNAIMDLKQRMERG